MDGEALAVYFIADIGANHDGDLSRAKELIFLAKEAGAHAAKFQHFQASSILSDVGFRAMNEKLSHQASWTKSVFEVYQDASVDLSWTSILRDTCDEVGIDFLSTPYSLELVDHLDPYVPYFKIGSGDLTWIELIQHIASKTKRTFLATGAADIVDVQRAVDAYLQVNSDLSLMQCTTNYTGSEENIRYVNLNVLKTYSRMFPSVALGLSDHTAGHVAVLGAIALGATSIEKHFTDDTSRHGPDHHFAMDPFTWKEMVERALELEAALGNEAKKLEANERESVAVQQRSIRLKYPMQVGTTLKRDDLVMLRPCPTDGIPPFRVNDVVGRQLAKDFGGEEHLTWDALK